MQYTIIVGIDTFLNILVVFDFIIFTSCQQNTNYKIKPITSTQKVKRHLKLIYQNNEYIYR